MDHLASKTQKTWKIVRWKKSQCLDVALALFFSIFHSSICFNATDNVVQFNDVGSKHNFDVNSQTKKFFFDFFILIDVCLVLLATHAVSEC